MVYALLTNLAPKAFFASNWPVMVATSVFTLVAKKVFDSCLYRKKNESLLKSFVSVVVEIPGAGNLISKEMEKEVSKIEKSVFSKRTPLYRELPNHPVDWDTIIQQLEEAKKFSSENVDSDKVSGTFYHCGDELSKNLAKVEAFAMWTNTLHPDECAWIGQREAEVLKWCKDLFHGSYENSDVCGTMSSGGTESIMLACKAYRNQALKRGITCPEIVLPESAHPAFLKAAATLCLKVIEVPVDPKTSQVILKDVEKALSKNTAFVVGSAPSFPHGIIDDIEGLSKIVIQKGKELQGRPINLHVDACLGGFVLAFLKGAPKFDFSIEGVTSLSADTHKFANATKGSSVILYRNKELLHHQYFLLTDSCIGIYATPTFAGSRPGTPIVAAWATMLSFGMEGYEKLAKSIVLARQDIENGIRKIDGLEVIGQPKAMVVAFTAKKILSIVSQMYKRKWHLNILPGPSVHLCVTNKHTKNPKFSVEFLHDLHESVKYSKEHPEEKLVGSASTYNSSMTFPTSVIDQAASVYFDVLNQVEPRQNQKDEKDKKSEVEKKK